MGEVTEMGPTPGEAVKSTGWFPCPDREPRSLPVSRAGHRLGTQ